MSALALDLGSTRIKAARFDAEGRRLDFAQHAAPPMVERGLVREFDPIEWLELALGVLRELRPRAGELLGIASQRSSFLLWSARDGAPVTAVISWQDRRAADWIAEHSEAAERVGESTGLPLSAHYVGPKLASLFAADRELARRAGAGELRLGTLETWLVWKLSQGRLHLTDESMAARTLLFDSRKGAWSPRLCELFGVPGALLPAVLPSSGRGDALGELVLSASIADQSAGALHAAGAGRGAALINIGTGTFVLAPTGATWTRRRGYPTSLLVTRPAGNGAEGAARPRSRSYACEGTVNAGANLIAAVEAGPQSARESTPEDAFALVDENGIGAPHWRADLGPIWSAAAQGLEGAARRRVAEQGLCFRVREILQDLEAGARRWIVAGGALHDAAFAQRLADALGRSIEVCLEPEATLAGVADLAQERVGEDGLAKTRSVAPSKDKELLDARFEAWRRWLAQVIEP